MKNFNYVIIFVIIFEISSFFFNFQGTLNNGDPYNEIQFGNKKELGADTCYNMDQLQKYYAK